MSAYPEELTDTSSLAAEFHHLRRRVERLIEHRTGFHGRIQRADLVWSELLDELDLLDQEFAS